MSIGVNIPLRLTAIGLLACLCAWAAAPAAHAQPATRERLAALVVAASPEDQALAEGLTDLVIATMAKRRRAFFAGTGELIEGLGDSPERVFDCLKHEACWQRTAVALGVSRVVVGTVARRKGGFTLAMALHDASSGTVTSRIFRDVDGTIEPLLTAVQAATAAVLDPPAAKAVLRIAPSLPAPRILVDGAAPKTSGRIIDLTAGPHTVRITSAGRVAYQTALDLQSGQSAELQVDDRNMPVRLRWPSRVVYGAGIPAVLGLATGIVTGLLAGREKSFDTRAQAQSDFQQRHTLGAVADISFATAAVLGTAAVYTAWRYRIHLKPAE